MKYRLTAGHKAVTLFLFAVLIWSILELPIFQSPFESKEESKPVFATLETELWLKEYIEMEAQRLNIPPVDARLDPVWKAIPGYNGLEIDVETTYQLAKKKDGPIPWVYREVPPRIQLDDLGAQPVYKGNPHKKMVSFAINVAWGEQYVPSMLETLRRENVSATFFLDGTWLSKNLDLAHQMKDAGHEISNHGYSHKNMSELSRSDAVEEIVKTERLLESELGVDNKLFAPPSGDYNEETVKIAHELQLRTVLWTLDTVDWKKPAPSTIIQRIVPRLEAGAIILMHPTEPTAQALPTLIREIKERGYKIGTVSELLSSKRIGDIERDPLFW